MTDQNKTKNFVNIFLARTKFQPGEEIEGEVLIHIAEKVSCNRIYVTLHGRQTYFVKKAGKPKLNSILKTLKGGFKPHEFSRSFEIVQKTITLSMPVEHYLEPGAYNYPFNLDIPPDLPGSCSIANNDHKAMVSDHGYQYEAHVQYWMLAGVEGASSVNFDGESNTRDILRMLSDKSSQIVTQEARNGEKQSPGLCACIKLFLVYEPPNLKPIPHSRTKIPLNRFTCFPFLWTKKIFASLTVYSAYITAGNDAKAYTTIRNFTKKPIANLAVSLVRILTIKDSPNEVIEFTETIAVEPLKHMAATVKLVDSDIRASVKIPETAQQNICSPLFDVNYKLRLTGHLPDKSGIFSQQLFRLDNEIFVMHPNLNEHKYKNFDARLPEYVVSCINNEA